MERECWWFALLLLLSPAERWAKPEPEFGLGLLIVFLSEGE